MSMTWRALFARPYVKVLEADKDAGIPGSGGTVVAEWSAVGAGAEGCTDTARVFRLSDEDVYPWHARFEPMTMFYIDGASAVDSEDDHWLLFAVTRQAPDGSWGLLSFATVYEFFVYGPDCTAQRARLSQIIVLPPFQRQGMGGRVLEAVRAHAVGCSMQDITVGRCRLTLSTPR